MKRKPSEQRQDSLTDQMNTVIDLARQHGCYDAWDWIKTNFQNTRPKPSVEWPSLKDEVANGDGKGKTDEWSIGWNEAVKVCQDAVEAAGLEYGLDEEKTTKVILKFSEQKSTDKHCIDLQSYSTCVRLARYLKLAERELIVRTTP